MNKSETPRRYENRALLHRHSLRTVLSRILAEILNLCHLTNPQRVSVGVRNYVNRRIKEAHND